jgi:hypothetical protein
MIWIVVGASAIVFAALVVALALLWKRRSARAVAVEETAQVDEPPLVHALDDALRTAESLTDAKGSSLLDQVDRDGRTIRDRLASGEAVIDSLRQPDDTGPLFGRVLDEVARANPVIATPAPPAPDS